MEFVIPNINDFEEVNSIWRQIHMIHVNFEPNKFKNVEKIIEIEEFNEMIENRKIFVAKINNEIVAIAKIDIKEKEVRSKFYRKLFLIDVFGVKEEFRGKGIGHNFMKFLLEKAKENQCTNLSLGAHVKNIKAIKFYEDFGFVPSTINFSFQIN